MDKQSESVSPESGSHLPPNKNKKFSFITSKYFPLVFGFLPILILGVAIFDYASVKNNTQKKSYFTQAIPSPTKAPSSRWQSTKTSTPGVHYVKTIKLEFQIPERLRKYDDLFEIVYKREGLPGEGFGVMEIKRENQVFQMGAFTDDFDTGRGTGFLDSQGFTFKDGIYYIRLFGNDTAVPIPTDSIEKVINGDNLKVILINYLDEKKAGQDFLPLYHTGKVRKALVNMLGNEKYPGFAVQLLKEVE